MEDTVKMKVLFIIINAGFAEEVIEITREAGIRGATIINARGEGAKHESFLGITVAVEKELIFSVTDECSAEKAMAAINEKMGIKTPAHSICFTMAVEKTMGLNINISEPTFDSKDEEQ